MNYVEVNFNIELTEDYYRDILANELAEVGFDMFEETENGLKAYIREDMFDEAVLKQLIEQSANFLIITQYQIQVIPHQNWNSVWESNFEPLLIDDRCYVRATFHQSNPHCEYEIVIDPKMAFGTGHHQTTSMMMRYLLEMDVHDKKVLDMGCGTGILAILSRKLGAKEVVAIDNDKVCYQSVIENLQLNKITQVRAFCGSKESIPNENFEIVLANINRNILLDQVERYAEVLVSGGLLVMSGFYEDTDLSILKEVPASLGLVYMNHKTDKNWAAAMFKKI